MPLTAGGFYEGLADSGASGLQGHAGLRAPLGWGISGASTLDLSRCDTAVDLRASAPRYRGHHLGARVRSVSSFSRTPRACGLLSLADRGAQVSRMVVAPNPWVV